MAEINFTPRLGEIFEATASQVNLFRSINSPGYVIGDIAITAAGATYEWDGDSWNSISVGGGGGAAQTPWAQDIDGAGFSLSDALLEVGIISAGRVVGFLQGANTAGIYMSDEGFGSGLSASIGSYGIDAGVGAYVKYAAGDTAWGEILHKDNAGVTALGAHTGTLTGASSLNVLKAGDTMTGLLIITQATANTGILASTGYSLTGSNATNMLDFTGTWNTSGNPVALKLAISNTASGANTKFLSFLAGASGTTEVFAIDKAGGFTFGDSGAPTNTRVQNISGTYTLQRANGTNDALEWAYNVAGLAVPGLLAIGTSIAARDTILARDAANTLALRNGVNAQAFNVYNTFTNASDYERFGTVWSGNVCYLQTSKLGTGTLRTLSLAAGGTLEFGSNGVTGRWVVNTSGYLLAGTDNTYDIGASGATRPRNLYVAGTTDIGGILTVASHGIFTRFIRTVTGTLAGLPAATTAGEGARAFINDGSTTLILGLGLTAAGSGANKVPVYSDGTNWIVG